MTEVLEIDLTILIDWDAIPKCSYFKVEAGDTDCSNEAEWIASIICGCSKEIFLCTPHKNAIVETTNDEHTRYCFSCGVSAPSNQFFIYRPI